MTADCGDGDRVNILLVDDHPANLLSLKGILDRPDYNLVTARSGSEALACVLQDDFALIVIDVGMPIMDGFETVKRIKQRVSSRQVPIVFVSASAYDVKNIFTGYTVGAVDYLQTPVDPHVVRSKVAVFVELYRQARQIERQGALLQEAERRERELLRQRADQAVCERERTEEALSVSEARFERLRDSGLIGIFSWKLDGQIVDANDTFLRIVGYARGDLDAKRLNWRELTPDEYDDADRRAIEELRTTGLFHNYEKELIHRDGHRVSVLLGGTFVDGSSDCGISFALDVTERRKIELERGRLVRELRDAIRSRDDFLFIAAHELKTPLTPLRLQGRSFLRALRKGGVGALESERLARALEMIDRSVVRLERLIDRLLDISRVTVGRLSLERESVDLATLVGDVVERTRPALQQAGCTLSLRTQMAVVGRWDRLRLEQTVDNLLSNAMKFGAGKPIEITLEGDDLLGKVTVRDFGVGMAADEQARIFNRFERLQPVRHFGGFGLGLWIVRQIVEAHGGEIRVWSQPGRLMLHRRAATGSGARQSRAPRAGGAIVSATPCQLLVVEDDADIRDSLREVLEAEGYAVCTASNGQEALELLSTQRHPCLILLDLMMPVMGGVEFLTKKSEERALAGIPVVVVSAWVKGAEPIADAQAVVTKPVVLEHLLTYVERYCGSR